MWENWEDWYEIDIEDDDFFYQWPESDEDAYISLIAEDFKRGEEE